MFSKDHKTQEILKNLTKFLQDIQDEDDRKRSEAESVYHKRFAFLPTRLSCGKLIFLRFYRARYEARSVNYIRITDTAIEVTDVYKHYIDKDFEPNFRAPIEKVL